MQDKKLHPSRRTVIAGALDSTMELFSLDISDDGESMVRMGTAGGMMIVFGNSG